jgi:hypothetical protein
VRSITTCREDYVLVRIGAVMSVTLLKWKNLQVYFPSQ